MKACCAAGGPDGLYSDPAGRPARLRHTIMTALPFDSSSRLVAGWVPVPDVPTATSQAVPIAGLSGERGTRYPGSHTVTGCSLGEMSGATTSEEVEMFAW